LRLYLRERKDATQEATHGHDMNGEVQLAAPREVVWTKLNDPEVLKACIPVMRGAGEKPKTAVFVPSPR